MPIDALHVAAASAVVSAVMILNWQVPETMNITSVTFIIEEFDEFLQGGASLPSVTPLPDDQLASSLALLIGAVLLLWATQSLFYYVFPWAQSHHETVEDEEFGFTVRERVKQVRLAAEASVQAGEPEEEEVENEEEEEEEEEGEDDLSNNDRTPTVADVETLSPALSTATSSTETDDVRHRS